MLRGSGYGGEGRTSSLGCGETKFWGRGLFGVSCEVSKQARSKRHGDCARAPRGADRRSGALIARVAGATWLRAPSPSSPPHSPPPSPTGPRRRRCHRVHVITVHAIPVCMVRVCARASRMCARAWMWLGWWAVAARADGPTPSWQLRQPTLWHCGRLSTSQQHAVVQRQQEAAMAQLHAQQPLGVNGPP